MTAPSLRSLGTVVATTTGSPSFAAPAGAVATDVIEIKFFQDDGRNTVTAVPTGFALAANGRQVNDASGGSPSHSLNVYWGRFSDVGAGPYGFTLSASSFIEGRAAAIKDCTTTGNPYEATNGNTSGNTSVTTAPSVSATSLGPDRYASYAATNWTGGAWTPATGFTEQWDANDEIITFDDLALPTAQTVTPQAVCVGNDRSNAWVGILLPVSSGGAVVGMGGTGPGRIAPNGSWQQFAYSTAPSSQNIGLADSGSGDDSSLTVTATIPLTDSGTGSEALAVTATVPLSDSGSGADALTVTVAVPLADSGTAADSITVSATVPLTDTGTGSDSIAAGVPIGVTDAGTGSDAFAVTATVPLAESGTAADALAVTVTLAVTDTGSAADDLSVLATLALVEAGTALDAIADTAAVPLADSGTGSDAFTAQQSGGPTSVTLTDGGAGRDRIHVICHRPATGTTARPGSGTTHRPNTGITYYQ